MKVCTLSSDIIFKNISPVFIFLPLFSLSKFSLPRLSVFPFAGFILVRRPSVQSIILHHGFVLRSHCSSFSFLRLRLLTARVVPGENSEMGLVDLGKKDADQVLNEEDRDRLDLVRDRFRLSIISICESKARKMGWILRNVK